MQAGPFDCVTPPPALAALGTLVPVWRNELGGLTFRGANRRRIHFRQMGAHRGRTRSRRRTGPDAVGDRPHPGAGGTRLPRNPRGRVVGDASNRGGERGKRPLDCRSRRCGACTRDRPASLARCPSGGGLPVRLVSWQADQGPLRGSVASRHPPRLTGWWSLTATRVHPIRCSPTTESPSPMSTCNDSELQTGGRISQSLPATRPSTMVRVGSGCFWRPTGWSRTPLDSSTTSSSGIEPDGIARRNIRRTYQPER